MKHSNLYYNDIYLGTLYENGVFEYKVSSDLADKMNMRIIVNKLEMIRQIGLRDDFDFDSYVTNHNNFQFKDGFEFK